MIRGSDLNKDSLRRFREIAKGLIVKAILINYGKLQRVYWEVRAQDLYDKWSKGKHDYQLISDLLDEYDVKSVLDIGCGYGRLFALYQSKNITDVIGVDISQAALRLANKAFPNVKTQRMRLADIDFGYRRFDLVISNRVLQHIREQNIDTVVGEICSFSKLVYVNELVDGDAYKESKYIFKHDYEQLFGRYGFAMKNKGRLDAQTWFLFSATQNLPLK